MVEDNDDTTELSDNALRDRLRRLRGEDVPEPTRQRIPHMPPHPAHRMPDLSPYGMVPLEVTATKDGPHDSIRYEMRVKVHTDEARDRILAAIRADDAMDIPAAFPNIAGDGVYVMDYDSGTQEAKLRAVVSLEEIVATAGAATTAGGSPTPLLIIGRRDRAEHFARTQGLATRDWRWVHRASDMLGYPPARGSACSMRVTRTPPQSWKSCWRSRRTAAFKRRW